MIYREATMSEPLTKWLRSKGYDVYTEVPSVAGLRTFDMVGQRGSDLVIIEMKRNLDWGVFHQAVHGQLATREVYCAILSNPMQRTLNRCQEAHLGVLQVRGEAVLSLLEPSGAPEPVEHYRKGLRDRLGLLEQGGTAGLPSQKGIGPAQLVDQLIQRYRKERPKATWKELYEKVPNHYASAQSMYGAMRMLAERRREEERRKGAEPRHKVRSGIEA